MSVTEWDLTYFYRSDDLFHVTAANSFVPPPLELDAGSVGLALSYSVTLMGMFQWGVRQSAEVENMVR